MIGDGERQEPEPMPGEGPSVRNVLLADNGLIDSREFTDKLQKLGFTVSFAETYEDCVQRVSALFPDICLVNAQLDGSTGSRVLFALRGNPRTMDIPVILFSERRRPIEVVQGLTLGAVDFVTKPFNVAELVARIKTQIRLHDALKKLKQLQQLSLDDNPLTGLPGHNSIVREICEALEKREAKTLVLADLDQLRRYNRELGFPAGDRVLALTAQILKRVVTDVTVSTGFVGHDGADDFILIVPVGTGDMVAEYAIEVFEAEITELLANEGDLKGETPDLRLSMAGIDLPHIEATHYLEVLETASLLMKRAKDQPGNVFLMGGRG